MSVELVEAIGQFVIAPICATVAILGIMYLILR
jgi:hypothetical protein